MAFGARAKTDAVVSRMLAHTATAFNPDLQAPHSKETTIFIDLHVARAGLCKGQTRFGNRAQTQDIPVLKRQTKVRLTFVERPITELDGEIATLVAAQKNTAPTCYILRSMPGVGAVSAAAMLTLMPTLGTIDRKQVARMASLFPNTRQPVKSQDRSLIGSWRKPLRDILYMPALVVVRCNPDLKEKYKRPRAARRSVKAAIVAVMRNHIEIANALFKSNGVVAEL